MAMLVSAGAAAARPTVICTVAPLPTLVRAGNRLATSTTAFTFTCKVTSLPLQPQGAEAEQEAVSVVAPALLGVSVKAGLVGEPEISTLPGTVATPVSELLSVTVAAQAGLCVSVTVNCGEPFRSTAALPTMA